MCRDYSLGPRIETDEHYALLRLITGLAAQHPGTAIEFGIGAGESTTIIAEQIPVVAFGSIHGLPQDWRPGYPKGTFAHPLPNIPNATLVEGWFNDTLPGYDFGALGPINLIHCDADLYASTATALDHIGACLQPGCFLVFDEWHGYDGAEHHEQRAWREYAEPNGFTWQVIGHSFQQWAIRLT